MGLAGILVALGLLIWLSFRGWSILLLAPAAALVAAGASGEPLLAHWTQTFMGGAAQFVAQFFPLFLLGALFGKLMEDSGSVEVIARFMTKKLGTGRALVAVVLAGAIVTYGGVSLFVAIFVLVPMAQGLFRTADIPLRIMPAAIALGTIAAGIMLAVGLWWLGRVEKAARSASEGYGKHDQAETPIDDGELRERASIASEFDPAEIPHGRHSETPPDVVVALLPLAVVILVNLAMSVVVLPRLDTSFLAEERWGATSLAAVGGVWAVVVALLT